MWYDTLNEKQLWKNFQSISEIPRESGSEEGIRNFLLSWAEEHGLEAEADKAGNVVIRKAASEGMEDVPSICLQGHMDMVCVKKEGSTHDFTKDPIEILLDGEFIRAKDTTLGADNGIAIAMAMTILEDDALLHGPLEALFTVSEETGLEGAYALDSKMIRSRRLVNLDSEEEGFIFTGCAGGVGVLAKKKAKMSKVPQGYAAYTLSISGLLGGHSGGEIHKGRANAIKLAARLLHRMPVFMLTALDGGTRHNVIPSSCTLSFVVPAEDGDIVESLTAAVEAEVKEEYKVQDGGITFHLTRDEKVPQEAVKEKISVAFIESLYLAPNGVQAMSQVQEGVVETSNTVAIAKMEDGLLSCLSSIRSLRESTKHETAYQVAAAFEDFGCKVRYEGDYPSWTPDPSSPFTKEVAEMYLKHMKKEPKLTSIHAGLECGIINSQIEGMDSLSIGPDLFGVHSVDERLSVPSAERLMDFLKYLLANAR